MQDFSAGLIVVLVVVGLLELALLVWALVDVIRRPQPSALPKWAWIVVMLVFNLLGPILYLVIGRQERSVTDDWRSQTPGQWSATPPAADGDAGGTAVAESAAARGAGGAAGAGDTPGAGSAAAAASDAADGEAADGAAAAGEDAVPAAPEAPDVPNAPGSSHSPAERAIDTLYGSDEQPK